MYTYRICGHLFADNPYWTWTVAQVWQKLAKGGNIWLAAFSTCSPGRWLAVLSRASLGVVWGPVWSRVPLGSQYKTRYHTSLSLPRLRCCYTSVYIYIYKWIHSFLLITPDGLEQLHGGCKDRSGCTSTIARAAAPGASLVVVRSGCVVNMPRPWGSKVSNTRDLEYIDRWIYEYMCLYLSNVHASFFGQPLMDLISCAKAADALILLCRWQYESTAVKLLGFIGAWYNTGANEQKWTELVMHYLWQDGRAEAAKWHRHAERVGAMLKTRPDLTDLSVHFQLASHAARTKCQECDCVFASWLRPSASASPIRRHLDCSLSWVESQRIVLEKDVWTRSCESNYIIWMTSHLIAGQTRPRKRGGPAEVKLLQTLLKRVFLPQCQRRVQPATSIAWLFWNIQLAACVFGTKPSTLLVACVLSRTLSEPRDRTRQMATQTARQHTVLSFNPFWAFLRHALFSTGLETQDRRDWCRDSDWNASATSFSACLLTRHLWYTDCTGYSRGSTMAAPRGPAHQAVAARPNGSNCFGFNLLLRLRPWNRHGTHTDIFASSGIQTSHSDGCTSVAVSSPCGILHH